MNRGRSPVIAVTNTSGSPLAKQADATLLCRAGEEFSVSCKTYLTALMVLQFLGDVLCARNPQSVRQDLKAVIPAVRDYLANWNEHVRDLARMFEGIDTFSWLVEEHHLPRLEPAL